MKIRIVLFLLLICSVPFTKVVAQNGNAGGYQIKVNINAYKSQYLFLAYHYGKIKALADSALVQADGSAIFKGKTRLPGGIYIMVSPKKEIMFELLLGKNQQFSIKVDTANLANPDFKGSADNTDFLAYSKFVQPRGMAIADLQKKLPGAGKADSTKIYDEIKKLNDEMTQYRVDYRKKSPTSFMSVLFAALQEPVVPPVDQQPKGDSTFAFRYYKAHYWDDIDLADERLLRTPFFEARVDRYFHDLVSPEPDSIKKEIDHFLLYSRSSHESYKYLLTHFVTKYINPEIMGQDAVYVYLFEKYINNKPEVDWFTEKYKKYMTDRVYSLMANLIGQTAWDLKMTDTTGVVRTLYDVKAPYTVVCFWDPTCGHCKDLVPRLDSMYQKKWRAQGIKIYGVMTDGGMDNWLKFIRENNLAGWIHVHQTDAQRDEEHNSGRAGFRQLYDVYQTPVLYLLDDQKRIIAKKLSYLQMDDLIIVREKQKLTNR